MNQAAGSTIWTVGHSTLALEEFIELLRAHDIQALADIRRYPGSRRHPHFARESLQDALPAAAIAYAWFPELGGRRSTRKGSSNDAWRNAGFRGYADYMETPAFADALEALLHFAAGRRTAYMCAEHAWQQCHRALVSDYLKAHGVEVVHILRKERTQAHPYTQAARIVDGRLSYSTQEGQGRLAL